MEAILGQPSQFSYCTRYTALTDELSRLTGDTVTKIVVISNLTGILVNLYGASDLTKAIEKAMKSLGTVIKELMRSTVGMRIFIAPCTPRNLDGFKERATQLMVKSKRK
jgi:hypothetical protein